jgi:hypothetical protein
MSKENKTASELVEMIRKRVPEMNFHHMQVKRDPTGWAVAVMGSAIDSARRYQGAVDAIVEELRAKYDLAE